MAGMKLPKIVVIVHTICVITIGAKLICRTRYGTIRCEPGPNDHILTRGLVSDNSETVSIILQLCRIIDVDLESFENNPLLKQIDLSRNKISRLQLGVFDDIKTLKSLRISRNLLTELPLGLFDQLPNLKLLDLSDNNIISFELGIFDPIPDLVSLYLSGNRFLGRNLNPFLFDQNSKMKSIHFSRNNMSETPEQLLNAVQVLKTLELNSCSLTEVPKFATRPNLKTMTNLQLQRNEIERIDNPTTFDNLENLESLDLTGNKIEKITVAAFKPLKKLNSLELSFNNIGEIPEDLFLNMPSVQSVDLSHNFIDYVSVDALSHKSFLETLNLVSNNISFLDRNFFRKLRISNRSRLSKFNIDDNPLQCACLLEIINDMKRYGYKYNSDNYDGEHVVCLMTDEFICKRDRYSGPHS